MNTFIILTLPRHARDSLEDKFMRVYSKKPFFFFHFGQEQNILGHSFEKRACRFDLKATQGMAFPIPQHRQSRQRIVTTLLIVNINPTCKRQFRV